jgi:hypothetical protein
MDKYVGLKFWEGFACFCSIFAYFSQMTQISSISILYPGYVSSIEAYLAPVV